jgi:hypothetical protein
MKHIIFIPAFVLLAALSALAQQTNHNEETVAQLQAEMASGKLTSVALTQFYINRILLLDQRPQRGIRTRFNISQKCGGCCGNLRISAP